MLSVDISLFSLGLKEAFSSGRTLAVFFLSIIVSAILSSFVLNAISLPYLIEKKEILINFAITADGILFIAFFSILVSIFISLLFYRYEVIRQLNGNEAKMGGFGLLIASFTSACSVCPPLLLTYLGFPFALSLLPFQGWEIRIFSLLLISTSVYFSATAISSSKNCKI